MNLKSITREFGSGIYVADERHMSGSTLIYFDKVIVNVRESKDVYYFNMSNGDLHVFRSKLQKVINGCLFVRDRDEYNSIYGMVESQGYANMPENMFARLDREWESRSK